MPDLACVKTQMSFTRFAFLISHRLDEARLDEIGIGVDK